MSHQLTVVYADPVKDEDRPLIDAEAAKIGATVSIADDEAALATLLPTATVVISQRTPITAEMIASASGLRQIQSLEWVSPAVDREAATARGIEVIDVPSLSMLGVAEHTILLMLALIKELPSAHARTVAGERAEGVEEVKTTARLMGYNWLGQKDLGWLYRRTLGIIGLGKIGQAVAVRANAFGMRVLYTSRTRLDPADEQRLNVRYADLDDLLARSDFVSVHMRMTPENTLMLGADTFAKMKPSAYFINTARGGLVDEAALIEALRSSQIAGAGLDVFEYEPMKRDNPLLGLDNVVLTPHIAGTYDPDARKAQIGESFEYVADLKGRMDDR